MRVVLDTNILISALITSVSPSAQVLALWRSRRLDLLTCAQQLEEFARATRYPQVRARLLPAVAGALLNRVRDRAMVLENLPIRDDNTHQKPRRSSVATCWLISSTVKSS